jgi:fucose permease
MFNNPRVQENGQLLWISLISWESFCYVGCELRGWSYIKDFANQTSDKRSDYASR